MSRYTKSIIRLCLLNGKTPPAARRLSNNVSILSAHLSSLPEKCDVEPTAPSLYYFHANFDANLKVAFVRDLTVISDFVSECEENSIMEELKDKLDSMRYEYDHWDNAIHGFREFERLLWNEKNAKIIENIRKIAFPSNTLQIKYVHVLDLADNGFIKPHIDSIRFCGNTIAGVSLLTDSIMRFVYDPDKEMKCDVLLKRRSLYIMKGEVRYKFSHEILKNEESIFKGEKIPKVMPPAGNEPNPPVNSPHIFKSKRKAAA